MKVVIVFTLVALALMGQDAKPMPLIHATALASVGGRVYAGTSSGEVHVYDARTREPVSVLTSERKGIVSSVAASSRGVAWIIGPRPTSIRDKFAAQADVTAQALIFQTPDQRTYTIDLKPAGVDRTVRALSWFGPRLWMLGDFGAAFYNASSSAIELGSTFLPSSVAEEVARSRVWVHEPYLMTVMPVSIRRNPRSLGSPYVSLFTVHKLDGQRWTKVGGFASNAFDVEPEMELSVGEDGRIPSSAKFSVLSETAHFDPTGIAAVESTDLLNAPIFKENWETTRQPLPGWFGESSCPDNLWVQVFGDDLWSWNGTALLKQSRTKHESRAFLPWNDPQMLLNAFLADSAGVWVATNVGVRRIDLGTPQKPLGYGGFIAVPLGPLTEKTDVKSLDKIVRELYRWRFALAELAGKDGARLVSEIYKSVGLVIPANAQGIINSLHAIPVQDELRVGDVIFSAKSLAIYIGNGKTVEVKDGVVQNSTVWNRPFAIVRRFVKATSDTSPKQAGNPQRTQAPSK
ncbi:MAG: C40 family peptidase [Chlorobia bacterium]|nr:C40 family peptidase [Fimbriimonadaceae bacterium]